MAYRNGKVSTGHFDDRQSHQEDRPTTYLLEHLATFTVSKESGIVFPADGMRRLLQLEKTTGIWSQKMQLCLDKQWVVIMDYNSGNEIERFSATTIEEPTAFTSNNPMEIYNNVLVIIVGGHGGNRSEMHIFQCQSISAVHLVENLKLLRSGKPMIQHQTSRRSSSAYREPITTDSETDSIIDESHFNNVHSTMTTSSPKYELEVKMLNHCFDDIEKFIARLQHAAAAARELERRHSSKKSKRKDPGDGLLAMRTRPPHEKEFIDILAKFKLSFNLLARLKPQIHDPNAPELVHFLFTPLALIIDALNDTFYDSNITARVILPLMTYEAINLLTNCVTSKESELWHSLGDAWRISKDSWHGTTEFYQPIFFNGWAPNYSLLLDELDGNNVTPKTSRKASIVAYEEALPERYNSPGSPGFRSQFSSDSTEYNGGDLNRIIVGGGGSGSTIVASHHENVVPSTSGWLDEIVARNGKIVQVTYPRTANNDKELSVVRGEHLEVLDDSRKWWKARNRLNQIGHVPHTIVMPFNYTNSGDYYSQFRGRHDSDSYDAVFESTVGQPSSSNRETTPVVAQQSDWIRNNHIVIDKKKIIKKVTEKDTTQKEEAAIVKINKKDDVPPPPAPPPPPPVAVASTSSLKRPTSMSESRKSISSSITSTQNDEMQVELRQMLTMFREKRNNLAIVKTPDIYIEQSASADEVEKWLKKKGFSDNVIKKLHNINGNELFALKRATLEEALGPKDGKRLVSQIEIQRNISGYKTTRSSELQAVLARARMKTEKDEQF